MRRRIRKGRGLPEPAEEPRRGFNDAHGDTKEEDDVRVGDTNYQHQCQSIMSCSDDNGDGGGGDGDDDGIMMMIMMMAVVVATMMMRN